MAIAQKWRPISFRILKQLKILDAERGNDPAIPEFLDNFRKPLEEWQRGIPVADIIYLLWRRGDRTERVVLSVAAISESTGDGLLTSAIDNAIVRHEDETTYGLFMLGLCNRQFSCRCCKFAGHTPEKRAADDFGKYFPRGAGHEHLQDKKTWAQIRWLTGVKIPSAKCHPSIARNQLNAYVLGPGMSSGRVSGADMWGIIMNDRLDFLEYLLVDRRDKPRALSDEDIMLFAATDDVSDRIPNNIALLQLIEKAFPGKIRGFRDAFGHDLLWYAIVSVCRTKNPYFARGRHPIRAYLGNKPPMVEVDENGLLKLNPLQKYLAGICDLERTDDSGISSGDLLRTPFRHLM
jgi:hypothetical protein